MNFVMKFTVCCGKPVESHTENLEKYKYFIEGPVPATGDTFCSRCKRDVTPSGNVIKTPRNADIDVNGNWKYETKKYNNN
jgi:hypothetical protein